GSVRGMLIDFDCAVRTDASDKTVTRPEMTGTLPFMSMNNLDIALSDIIDYIPAAQSGLDDWESLIYVLCWLGIFGINIEDEAQRIADVKAQKQEKGKASAGLRGRSTGQARQKEIKAYDDLFIRKWRDGSIRDVAGDKRLHMQSFVNFDAYIAQDFYKEDYESLQEFVYDLRESLFDNAKYSQECVGTVVITSKKQHINPFQARLAYASNIMSDLLAVARDHRAKAIERMSGDK
ncbi:hypothetical protein LPJ56_001836, partial [Coemansia sp. RSA 2599]